MSDGQYQGVILAAGHGSRMGPFGEEVPKPVAPICNRPLMAYQLDYMRNEGIEDVVIVIGHLGNRITQVLGDGSEYGVRIRYIEQKERLGMAHAVGQLEPHVDRPFVLMLGDIFFEMPGLEPMLRTFEAAQAAAVLAVKEEPDPEAIKRNFAVLLNADGSVRRVIEKPRTVPNNLKGCGIYLFDERIFEAVRRTPRTAMRDEYELTDSIQILVDYEYPVHVSQIVDWDMNLTFIGDLIRCCRHELAKRGVAQLIGEDSHVHADAELVETVIGNRVRIEAPVKLERCVVLDEAIVSEAGEYHDVVITSDGILSGDA